MEIPLTLRRMVPSPMRRGIRRTLDVSLDAFDALFHRTDPLMPPRRLRFVGSSGDYRKIGLEFVQYFKELGGLQPEDHVLDVGSGIGRMAAPLASYLAEQGSYEGFDIVADGVSWCTKNISARFPNFHFVHSDVYNKLYNPGGKTLASEFIFPYDDSSFDFVYLTSVFTHMLPPDMENYLGQISRVLKRGARCLITFFLINEESSALAKAGKGTSDFKFRVGQCWTTNMQTPEEAIGYDETFVRALFCEAGLQVQDPIRYGSWCGRDGFLSYQDIVLSKKA